MAACPGRGRRRRGVRLGRGTRSPPGERGAYVYDVCVVEGYRGRGYGRVLMLVAERIAHEAGAPALGLHVAAGNVPAAGLYTSLGYRPVLHHFAKPLL
nr:GNAT family N-acetyltransferase [Streptomyces sp. I6]